MYNKKWSQQIYSNPNNFQSTFIQVPQQPNYPTNQLTQQPFQQSLIHPYQPPKQFFQQQLQPLKQPSLSLGQQFQQNLQQFQPFQSPQFQKPPQQFLPFQNPPPQQNNNLINQQQETQPFFQQPVHSTLISANFSNLPLPYINLPPLDQQKFQLDHPILRKRPNSKRNDLQISNNQKEEKDPKEEKFGYRLHLKTDDIAKLKTKLGLIKTFLKKKGTTINKINFSAVLVNDQKSSFHDCMASIKKVSELLCIYVKLDEELKSINKYIRQYIDWTNHLEAKFGPVKYHVKFASQNRVLQDFNHLIKLFVAKLENGSIKPKYLSKKNSSKIIQNSSNYKKRRVLNRSDRNQNTNQININTRQYQENKRWDGGNGLYV
ncbi:hypothetical protein M0812_03133 [Anaeramoeba flamelloides]|uniref:Uncharacterized protein n=1 Tax=Anaeramoeba flamelloides TaxID=1746091 RepID=A0AAV7YRL0_9EUKA|nr:hypothetical protein M0812_03133 [Anaeramoeba flamelloides]